MTRTARPARRSAPLRVRLAARASTLALVGAVGFAAVACDAKEEAPKEEEEVFNDPKVELPAAPNFEEGKVDEQYPDGAYSVYGLRRKLDERVAEGVAGTEITVRAYIQEIYVPDPCPEGEVCPPGKQPHVWVVDQPDVQGKKRAMMVVNYAFVIPESDAKRWKDEPAVLLEKGKQYTFKGKFKRFSDTGFADDRGLLEFLAYKAKDPETGAELDAWVYPPGAAWHPLEIKRIEEENAALAEQAAKTAADYKNRGK
jgi:hypothetical protein